MAVGCRERINSCEIQGEKRINKLKTEENTKEKKKKLSEKKGKRELSVKELIVLVLVLTGVLSAVCYFTGNRQEELVQIRRPENGEGSREIHLVAQVASGGGINHEMTVRITGRKCSVEELPKLWEKAEKQIDAIVFKNNESADKVTKRLILPDEIAEMCMKISWTEIDSRYIYSDGSLNQQEITQPVITYLTAKLEYFDEVEYYTFPLCIQPITRSDEELFEEQIKKELSASDAENSEEEYMTLPEEISGVKVNWNTEADSTWLKIIIIGVITAGLILPVKREEEKRQKQKRERELRKEYPNIIAKFVMLLTAGMTNKGAWTKMCSDYEINDKRNGIEKAAYEEMLATRKQLDLGVPEQTAYEQFGRACRVREYQRFATLIANSLKRGNRDLLQTLQREAEESYATAMEEIKKSGEEAGTKLVIPMVGMLCIVIATVMVPAIISFGL